MIIQELNLLLKQKDGINKILTQTLYAYFNQIYQKHYVACVNNNQQKDVQDVNQSIIVVKIAKDNIGNFIKTFVIRIDYNIYFDY